MGDAYWNNTSLLWSADGADADAGPWTEEAFLATLTAAANAQLDTSQFKFGTASALFDGTGDVITTPTAARFDFGTGDFTIELWARFNNVGISTDLLSRRASSASVGSWIIHQTSTTVNCYFSSTGASWDIASAQGIGTVATGQWYHIAIARSGTTFRTYLNGVQGSTWESSASIYVDASALTLGGDADGSAAFDGWIDEVRITKGVARYTGAGGFSPPSSAFDAFDNVTVAVSAPAPTLITGTDGVVRSAPAPTLSATGLSGGLGTVAVTAPAPTLAFAMDTPVSVVRSAPPPELSATVLSGEVITAALRAPAATLVAVNFSPAVITMAGSAPAPRATIAVLSGSVLTTALEAAAPTLVAAGYPAYTITAVLVAPAPRLDAELSGAITAAFRAWALNTRKLALTEYTNFELNSFAVFNGVVLAAGSSGVVALGTQGMDNATAITGRYRTGQESFGSSLHKRVPRIYTSGSFAGDMLFRTITTEGGTRTYSLPTNGITGLQQRRVPVGKGPKSRFFQFEGENVSGADFSVNDVLVLPTALRRRVQ